MKRYYCTYFDRNYLVKALALISSLNEHEKNEFHLIAICLDEVSRVVINKLQPNNVTTIPLHVIEQRDEPLLKAKGNRSLVEYYWTLTPTIILHLLKQHTDIDFITYIDADLYFYSSPEPIYREFDGHSILIHGHRFSPAQKHLEQYGKYNVGLMCFRNDTAGIDALTWWRGKCIEWCYSRIEDGKFGDQLYLNDWPLRFKHVKVLENVGAGVAPWNHEQYRYSVNKQGMLLVNDTPLIFYHFHALAFCSPEIIIPAKHIGYPLTEEILRLCFLPYIFALSRGITAVRLIINGFSFGLGEKNLLTTAHTFLAKKELAPVLKQSVVLHSVIHLDNNWDCYCSPQMLNVCGHEASKQKDVLPLAGQIPVSTNMDDDNPNISSSVPSQRLNFIDILNQQVESEIQARDFSRAKELLAKILEQSPNNIQALNNLVVVEIFEKNWDTVVETIKKVLHLDPSNEIAIENSKRLEKYLVLYKAVLEAESLIGHGKYDAAYEILEKVLEIDKNHVDALNAIAKIRIARGDFEGSGKVLTRVLEIHPANKLAIENFEFVKKQLNVTGHVPLSSGIAAFGTTGVTSEACSEISGKEAESKMEMSNQKWSDRAVSNQDASLREYLSPQITIITVCLNSALTIERSIKSVLSQTYKKIEYIFVDGGSNDGTLDVIKKYNKYVTHIISEKDNGIYDAMNKGLRLAKGTIVYFLNTDDLLYDESVFETVVKTFQRFPLADVVYGNAKLVYENGENADAVYPNNLDWNHFRDRSLCHQSVFTKRSAFEKVGLFESQYKLAGDYAWILKSIWVHDLNYQHVPKPLSLFSMSGKHSRPANVVLLENERQTAINEYIAKRYDFAGTANKYKVTAFVITIDDPAFPYCLEALTNQSCKNFKIDVVRRYRPVSAADQEMINRCDTEYFIKADEDMILHPNAVEKMVEFMELAPNNVGMICFHLYDKERDQNIQGVKIFRTGYLKDFMVHNVRASDVDLLEQMHKKGIRWILHPVVMGLHGTVYSPETIYRRYKSMYEKDIFIWNILTWDIRKKAENYRKTGDPLQLFALLGAVHGIINVPHAEDVEAKDFASYNLKELELFKKLFLENPPYTIEYDAHHSIREFSGKPIPLDQIRWKNVSNNRLDNALSGQTHENKGNAVAEDVAFGLLTKAEDLFQKGQYEEAITNYKKAIDVNASFFDAYFNLSLVYAQVNQIDDAIACLNKAAGLRANDASVHNNLGVLYFKKKQYGDAKVCFEKALSIDTHYMEAQNNLERVSDKMRR